jgi:hypothetical protein
MTFNVDDIIECVNEVKFFERRHKGPYKVIAILPARCNCVGHTQSLTLIDANGNEVHASGYWFDPDGVTVGHCKIHA